MKTKNFNINDLHDLLESKPTEGKLFFEGARALILNADAFGTLRKDLIHNLGYKRAKGFLLRYGWQLGNNDGMLMKEKYNWESREESLIAGAALFALEGFAKVEDDVIAIDREKKTFFKRAKLFNSFEAEQHQKIFGVSDQSVCWMNSGYASGYCSALLGEPVYFFETKCIAKGDNYCETEGKTLAEWEESDNPELVFYKDSTIKEELDNAYSQIQEQNKRLERSLSIHKEIYQLVLNGEDFSGITETISRISGGEILFFDTSLDLVAKSSGLDIRLIEKVRYLLKQHFAHSLSSLVKVSYKSVDNLIMHESQIDLDNSIFSCCILPIVSGEKTIGFVSALYKGNSEKMQESLIVLQRAADIYALEIMRQEQRIEIEHNIRADFIDSLFSHKYSNAESIIAWGERLGYKIPDPHYVLAMEIDFGQLNISSEKKLLTRKEVIEVTNKWINEQHLSVACAEVDEKVVILLPALVSKGNIMNIAQKLIEGFSYLKSEIYIGIGGITDKIEDYYQSYVQACKALKVIKSFDKKDRILFYDDLGATALLFDVENTANLVNFMRQKLKPILDYDYLNNFDLLSTLEQYLSTRTITEAASVTNLSLSGLKYRLGKLKDFGYNLNSADELYELQLAVKIYHILN